MTDRILDDNYPGDGLHNWLVDTDPVDQESWAHELNELQCFLDADVSYWSYANVVSDNDGLYFTGTCAGNFNDPSAHYIAKLPLSVMYRSLRYQQRREFADKYYKFMMNQRDVLQQMEKGWLFFRNATQYIQRADSND